MYLPEIFRQHRLEELRRVIRERPLATVVTSGSQGLSANHIPLLLDAGGRTLRGHVARPNPLWSEAGGGLPALAIFHGPQHYISPSWYVSKDRDGRVVPTWNYVAVHVHGVLRSFDGQDALLANVRELTAAQEASSPQPWSVEDAPPAYIEGMLRGIVGVELEIERIEGKWKVSQNRLAEDRASAATALRNRQTAGAGEMAALIEGWKEL